MNSDDRATNNSGSLSNARKYLVLFVVSLTTFMVFVDGTVVNTALPSIALDLSASNSQLQWVVNSYSLLVAGLLLVGGSTGDRFGRRKILAAGAVVFAAGAVGAALAFDSTFLIMMRGVQGVGAAFMLPSTLSIITDVFERQERAKAIAIWTMVGGMAMAFGPITGGLLVDHIGWEAVFWLHVPITAVILIGLKSVPESRDSRQLPLDVQGAALGTAGLLSVVFAIIQGPDTGWDSGLVIGAFITGAVLLLLFAWTEVRSPAPMLPIGYLGRKDFVGPALMMTVLVLAMSGIFFFTTQFLQLVQGRTALMSGLAIVPVAGTMMLGAGIAAAAGQKLGPRLLSIVGSLIVMGGMAVMLLIEVDSSYAVPVAAMALFGFGMGIVMPVVTDTIMAAVPVDQAGLASSMNDTSREFGFALGVAVLGSVVSGVYRDKVVTAVDGLVPATIADSLGDGLSSLGQIAGRLTPDAAASVSQFANQAFVDALWIGVVAGIGIVTLSVILAVATMPAKMRTHQGEFVAATDD